MAYQSSSTWLEWLPGRGSLGHQTRPHLAQRCASSLLLDSGCQTHIPHSTLDWIRCPLNTITSCCTVLWSSSTTKDMLCNELIQTPKSYIQCESKKVSPLNFLRYYLSWWTCVIENYLGYCTNTMSTPILVPLFEYLCDIYHFTAP